MSKHLRIINTTGIAALLFVLVAATTPTVQAACTCVCRGGVNNTVCGGGSTPSQDACTQLCQNLQTATPLTPPCAIDSPIQCAEDAPAPSGGSSSSNSCTAPSDCPLPNQVGGGSPCAPGLVLCRISSSSSSSGSSGSSTTPTQYLRNPLGTDDVSELIGRVIKGVMGLAGSLALLAFIYGGISWLTAAGNPEKIKKGQEIIKWTVLGMVLMFGSYIIVKFILDAITTGTAGT